MDYKTKRTVLSSSVIISSVIICLVCSVVLVNAFSAASGNQPLNTPTPADTPSAQPATAAPVTTPPVAASSATPTQTYHNAPYTTAPQNTDAPNVTISVTETPPVTEAPVSVDAALTYFSTRLIAFDDSTATYELTLGFNAGGKVSILAVDSARGLTATDVNPNTIRNVVSGSSWEFLSTPQSVTSGVATANTNLTLTIRTGLNLVDFFIIIDTDVENGLMANTIVQKSQGFDLPTIAEYTTPTVKDGYLAFDVILTKDLPAGATVRVSLPDGTLVETATDRKASFSTQYKEGYAGASLRAYIQCQNVDSTSAVTLPAIVIEDAGSGTGEIIDNGTNAVE